MGVSVAEYLGVRVDVPFRIVPFSKRPRNTSRQCPFRNHTCDKLTRGQHPVCSVRDTQGKLWIVCQHRLCATQPKAANLNAHQNEILRLVAQTVFDPQINDRDILVKREVPLTVTVDSDYKADYVMWRQNAPQGSLTKNDRPIVLEMQGGGETSGTGKLSKHIKTWESSAIPTNAVLAATTSASPLPTNAWRRQQEQFLVKGNVAMMTGGKMVFCVGSILYDYLIQRLTTINLVDLKQTNWTLALLTFVEDKRRGVQRPPCAPYSIPLKLDPKNCKFTNYGSFVQALTNQGNASPGLFLGKYISLSGKSHLIT